MGDRSSYIVCPTGSFLLGGDGRAAYRTKILGGNGGINRVSVAETQPGLYAHGNHMIYNVIQPCKIIDSLFFLSAHPARLKTGPLNAGLTYKGIGFIRVKDVAVQLLKAQTDAGMCDFAGFLRLDLADFDQTFHVSSPFYVFLFQKGVTKQEKVSAILVTFSFIIIKNIILKKGEKRNRISYLKM